MTAAYRGHTEIIQLLLAHPEILVNEKDSYGATALIYAASNGHPAITQLLLSDPRIDLKTHDQ